MRWGALACLLVLWAAAAQAASPTLGNSSAFTGCGGSSTCTFSVTTAHANAVVVFQVATQNAATTAPTVTAFIDNGAAGLTVHQRGSAVNSNNTTCASGATNPCSGNSEVWWTCATSTLSSESFKATISTTGNNFTVSWGEIDGTFNCSSPWDTNAVLPVTNHGVNSIPSISGFATSESDDLLIVLAHNNINTGTYAPCPVASWGTTIANVTAGNNFGVRGAINSVSSTQSFSVNLTSTSTCNAGNTSTDGWTVQMDALTADAPAATGGGNVGLPIGPPPFH